MIYKYTLKTGRENFYDITSEVAEAVSKSGIQSGTALVWCPHTTAGITVNENADPDVVKDLLFALDKTYPDRAEFRHAEGNSAAHLKSSVMGCSKTFIVEDGRLFLGTWQGIYFTEFDGPRTRNFFVKVIAD